MRKAFLDFIALYSLSLGLSLVLLDWVFHVPPNAITLIVPGIASLAYAVANYRP